MRRMSDADVRGVRSQGGVMDARTAGRQYYCVRYGCAISPIRLKCHHWRKDAHTAALPAGLRVIEG